MSTGNIILTGFMGAGKTTVGRRLAKSLGLPHTDTDSLIEQKSGKRIRDIFAEEGEGAFQSKETQVLRDLLSDSETYVISCGGGLPLREENRELLRQLGTVFFLDVSADTVYRRLRHDKSRPLLQVPDPEKEIKRLLEERKGAYRSAAAVIIDANEENCRAVLSKILQNLENKA